MELDDDELSVLFHFIHDRAASTSIYVCIDDDEDQKEN